MSVLTTNKSHDFLVYYQGALAVAAVIVFFTNISVFLAKWGYGIPLYWLYGFLAASVPLWFSIGSKIKYIPQPMIIWSGVYLAMSSISILILPQIPGMQLLEDQIRSLIFLFLMLLLFSQYTMIQIWVRVTVLIVSLMNVFNHIYEFFNPHAFGALHAFGRPAGFYINSNQAGCALILGMIFSIDLIKPKYRIFYALTIGLGVALTFSRGAMLGWLIVIAFMNLKKVIPKYQIVYFAIGVATVILVLLSQINNLSNLKAADGTPLFNDDTLTRVEFILDPLSEKQDTSRVSLAKDAWQSFAEQPFLGKGLGGSANSKHKSVRGTAQKPHNTYLTLMIEYGFLGVFLYPMLLLASIWQIKGKLKTQGLAFVTFLLIWGLFSHTIISSFVTLLLIALMASLTEQSKNQIICNGEI